MYIIKLLPCILVMISVSLINADSPTDSCSDAMTALPPARDSNCCGSDIRFGVRIFGGSIADLNDYPWLVAIQYEETNIQTDELELKVNCGGSLISGQYVLTAAHCLYKPFYKIPKNVLLGAFNVTTNKPACRPTSNGGTYCTDDVIVNPIQKIIIHPDYKSKGSINDIALIKLSSTAPFTDFIRPICLPPRDYTINPPEPFDLYIAGWGYYDQPSTSPYTYPEGSDVKRHVQVPYVNYTVCEQHLLSVEKYRNVSLSSNQLCAGGEPGKGACRGDSGGPLMYKNLGITDVVGVLSYGPSECGQANVPDVYTNVYPYIPWITSTIEAESNLA